MTVFDKKIEEVSEIEPGSIVVFDPMVRVVTERFAEDPAEEQPVHLKEFIFPGEMILIFTRKEKP